MTTYFNNNNQISENNIHTSQQMITLPFLNEKYSLSEILAEPDRDLDMLDYESKAVYRQKIQHFIQAQFSRMSRRYFRYIRERYSM